MSATEPSRAFVLAIFGEKNLGKTALFDALRMSTGDGQSVQPRKNLEDVGFTFLPWTGFLDTFLETSSPAERQPPRGLYCLDLPALGLFDDIQQWAVSVCNIALVLVKNVDALTIPTFDLIRCLAKKEVPVLIVVKHQLDEQETPIYRFDNHEQASRLDSVGKGLTQLFRRVAAEVYSMGQSSESKEQHSSLTAFGFRSVPGLGNVADAFVRNSKVSEGRTFVFMGKKDQRVARIHSILVQRAFQDSRQKTPYLDMQTVERTHFVKLVLCDIKI